MLDGSGGSNSNNAYNSARHSILSTIAAAVVARAFVGFGATTIR